MTQVRWLGAPLLVAALAGPAQAEPPSAAPAPPPPPSTTRMASPGLVAGGALLATAGVTATALGVLFAVAASVGCLDTCAPKTGARVITGATIVLGIGAIAGGVVMMVRGARRVPAGDPAAALGLPAWAGAPGGAGWRWRF